jgi:hypothetical protein
MNFQCQGRLHFSSRLLERITFCMLLVIIIHRTSFIETLQRKIVRISIFLYFDELSLISTPILLFFLSENSSPIIHQHYIAVCNLTYYF